MTETPSLAAAAEYLGDELYASCTRMQEQYRTAAPDQKQAWLLDLGLNSLLTTEVSALSGALEMLDVDCTGRGQTRKGLGKTLDLYSESLSISPELADYIKALPAKELSRGEEGATASWMVAPNILPSELPARFQEQAQLVQCLLLIDQVAASLRRIAEGEGKLATAATLIGTQGPCALYYDPRMPMS